MQSREDVAASCGVPVEWVPTNHASMSEDELVATIEDAMMAESERARQAAPKPPKPPKTKSTVGRDISTMRETDTYGDYVVGICTHPWLRLHDGSQAVNLQRRFVGATLSHDGSHMLRHGETGQADLCGGLVIERLPGERVEIRLEVEVKTGKGRVSKQQEARQVAFRKRGGIYLIVRSVDDAVSQIVAKIMGVWVLLGWDLPHQNPKT